MRADLALIGFGNVGRRFVRLIDERRDRLARDYDLECRVVSIVTRRHGSVVDARGVDVNAALAAAETGEAFANCAGAVEQDGGVGTAIGALARSDAPLRVAVEATTLDIRAGQPAIDHVAAALDAGVHVVTANKGPVAFAYHELRDRARRAGVSFLFEGAVMDGIPIFNLVRETLPAVDVIGFRGIVNSTTNHIITALERGESFAAALARMQSDGIAEADPSLDVDGWDAAAKTAALANVLMDARITPHAVARTGIGDGVAPRAREAMRCGRRLKLVASAERVGNAVRAAVGLESLPAHDLLAGLDGMANALVLRTDILGEIAMCELEGSVTATAYALVSDLVTIRRRQQAPGAAPLHRNL
jgi:homoserine dehydrogenase